MTLPHLQLTVPPPAAALHRLVADAVASRIGAGDPTVWPGAAADRLGWVDAARASRPLRGEIAALAEHLRVSSGIGRLLLVGAGGADVAAAALLPPGQLTVLDPDPAQVADALAGDLDATVLVVSAPRGEPAGPLEAVWDVVAGEFRADGLDPSGHTVVVTPPDGPLRARATAEGCFVVVGDPHVDGPWTALTAYGLVPAGLAGADVAGLLDDAAATREALTADGPDNPALRLGALLAGARTVAVADGPHAWLHADGGPTPAEAAAELLGAATGKAGRGPLPLLVEGPDAPEWARPVPGTLRVGAGADGADVPGADVAVAGPPGAHVVLWQHAAAVAAHLLGVDPAARPDTGAAQATAHPIGADLRSFTDGVVTATAGPWLPGDAGTVGAALRALVAAAPQGGRVVVQAWLDPAGDASTAVLRAELARRTGLPVRFGWAPRCLSGSGRHTKGGPPGAVVLQLTAPPDGPGLPGADAGLTDLQLARARADTAALAARGRPVLHLRFADRAAGLVAVAKAVQDL